MRLSIIESQEKVTEKIKECITAEMCEDGLLEDVETFVPSYRMDEPMEEPLVWLFEHPTTVADPKSGALSQRMLLQTPFEFVCVVYDEEDIEQSEMLGKNLASRVAASIACNAHKFADGGRLFNRVKFDTLYPVGEVLIDEKSEKAPATSVRIIVEYYVDWRLCCKKELENNDNQGD